MSAYTNLPGLDVAPDLPNNDGAANNGNCNNLDCCKAKCDADPACGVYMFGSLSWCTNCCWIKGPQSGSPSALAGVTSYVKQGEMRDRLA